MSNFIVLQTTDEDRDKEMQRIYRIAKLNERWERQFFDSTIKSCSGKSGTIAELPQDELAKMAFAGVKYICSMREVTRENIRLGIDEPKTLAENQVRFQMIDGIFSLLGSLTVRIFVNTFPIIKQYDGKKWGEKDYFFTMDVLNKLDWDKPIGRDNVYDLLWDYQNHDLIHICVEFTTAMSAIYRSQTGKGIAEKFCDDMGIGTYTINKENGIVMDNQTGHTTKLKKRSHIEIVK